MNTCEAKFASQISKKLRVRNGESRSCSLGKMHQMFMKYQINEFEFQMLIDKYEYLTTCETLIFMLREYSIVGRDR